VVQTRAQLGDISNFMFPWHDRPELNRVLDALARRNYGLDDILEKYTYPSHGQYMWIFGRIGNFSVKSNSDGSFNATIKIVGQSEDEFAYTTTRTVVPRKDASSEVFCASDTNSVRSYFANSASDLNLKSLLDSVVADKIPELSKWRKHVVVITQGNQIQGDPQPATQTPVATEKTFAEDDNAYFMTWRFFINVVINDPTYGVRAILARAFKDADKLSTVGLLKPYIHGTERQTTDVGALQVIDDPKESYVGMNKYLRSTDPSTLIIINKKAVEAARSNEQYKTAVAGEDLLVPTVFTDALEAATVSFDASTEFSDRGFLSSGVWINHKAVVTSMLQADTILRGITNLLERMNAATMNYWQLTLDTSEGDNILKEPNSYSVVDANWFESSDRAVAEFIENVHAFNKYVRIDNAGNLVGSELLECSVDLSLPKRLFAQIATLGILQPSEIAAISAEQQKVGDPVTTSDPTKEANENFALKIADPNNTFARMFGITSLSEMNGTSSIDLTVLPLDERQAITGTCGKVNTQLVAGTDGQGFQVANVSLPQAGTSDNTTVFDQATTTANSSVCTKCEPCLQARAAERAAAASTYGKFPIYPETFGSFPNLKFRSEMIGQFVSKQLLTDVNEAIAAVSELNKEQYKVSVNSLTEFRTDELSRHPKGQAIDLGTVSNRAGQEYIIRGATSEASYDRPGLNGKLAETFFDELAEELKLKGYQLTTSETGVPRAIIWKTAEHFNHMHVSNNIQQTTPTQPQTPTPTQPASLNPSTPTSPSPTGTQQTTAVCSDTTYEEIGRMAPGSGDNIAKGKAACDACDRAKQQIAQIKQSSQTSIDIAVRKFSGYRNVPRYVEIFPEYMMAEIAGSSNDNASNAFGAAPGSLSIAADLVMPGISGLRVGELFWIDRVPTFYKAFGAFQIISMEDTIALDGWKTKIHSRFNYLGATWRNSMYKKLGILVPTS
jgi:hypothetical protein